MNTKNLTKTLTEKATFLKQNAPKLSEEFIQLANLGIAAVNMNVKKMRTVTNSKEIRHSVKEVIDAYFDVAYDALGVVDDFVQISSGVLDSYEEEIKEFVGKSIYDLGCRMQDASELVDNISKDEVLGKRLEKVKQSSNLENVEKSAERLDSSIEKLKRELYKIKNNK